MSRWESVSGSIEPDPDLDGYVWVRLAVRSTDGNLHTASFVVDRPARYYVDPVPYVLDRLVERLDQTATALGVVFA